MGGYMLHRIHSRLVEDPLRALLEGDVVFFKDGDGDDGAGGSGSGGSSQEDDDETDDDDDGAGGSGDDGDGSGDDDGDEADARVRRANRQAAKARLKAKELQKELDKLRNDSGGDGSGDGDGDGDRKNEQKAREAEDRAAKAEARLARIEREATITKVVTRFATRDGKKFADADTVIALVESGRVDGIDPDEEIDSDDLADALKALSRSKPHLLGESTSTGGDGRRERGTNPRKKDRTNEELSKLPPGQRAHARLMRAFSK